MTRRNFAEDVERIREEVHRLVDAATERALPATRRNKIDHALRALAIDVEAALEKLDPVALPTVVFDPSNPKVIGRFTALAMIAQDRLPLAELGKFYGSGVYAIYYRGEYAPYLPLSGSETPIYVGQAAPSQANAHTPRDQGPRLAARLNEHRKNIAKADTTLKLADFEARFLVVQSGWETAAEDYLINLFRPIWNSETNILYGLGKHGDDAETRANKRSPWDTLHPGRKWAAKSVEDARDPALILSDLTRHFSYHPPVTDRASLLETFFAGLRQR
ncbi:MAG: Eco29kI family restriction endonuclease [Alphaproteobacteria bacterium]|nr:Eco29kI family restriction endonuclease [Alphaproteobacteria bacterium]MBU2040891.1 Eco29kI family restriction endonuclease [Alphaproteobacteria bacterium]MBU2125957.1 Eco29kI family restriction endonuclease [Alphaproteobacteria bacterium]MBU2209131.1 Eco29kI family restriction endonuclease [Alphaproteobacteria bacterium]MBU2292161.1 Eco29kI family restriction endonuclease [Alphaproteobacteria bacterium]